MFAVVNGDGVKALFHRNYASRNSSHSGILLDHSAKDVTTELFNLCLKYIVIKVF